MVKGFNIVSSEYKPRVLFLISLLLIGAVFIAVSIVTYNQFSQDAIKNEFDNQQRMTQIINQLLERYFYTLKFITQNTVVQPEFDPELTKSDRQILYTKITGNEARNIVKRYQISTLLSDPKHALNVNSLDGKELFKNKLYTWQVYKALPEIDNRGKKVALARRLRAKSILDTYKDIHYVFQMKSNGDLIFLEPFDIQKNISIFNYDFRDYLNLTKKHKETSISEGYISNDQGKTQIITVANPILNKNGDVSSIFSVSVSSSTLRDQTFRTLKKNINVSDGTIFYLIDRHGHVVASSTGNNIYFPVQKYNDDLNDPGNLRAIGFFKEISWKPDNFEKGNLWQRKIASWDEGVIKNLYSGKYKNLDGIEVLGTFLPTTLGGRNKNWGILIEAPLSQVLASDAYLRNVFYISGGILGIILAAIFLMTIRNFSRLESKILQKEKEIVKVTRQVAHDIRSPLVALDMLLENLSQVEEEKRVTIHRAVNRINDIANNLLIQYKKNGDNSNLDSCLNSELVALMVDTIISEKRIQYSEKDITFHKEFQDDTYGAFVKVNSSEFKRAISNLINNSVDAITGKGLVIIKLIRKGDALKLCIIDNGCGIPQHLIPKVMKGEVKSEKQGSGLGLSYAIDRFETWSCSLQLKSELERGTTVEITMPISKPPKWFLQNLNVKQGATITVLDDDESIHGVWDQRFNKAISIEDNIKICHFMSPKEFIEWYKENGSNHTINLIDYELLGHDINGIDVIKKLNIANQAVLVTSRFDDENVRSNCESIGLKAIPKNYSLYISIEIICINPDLIFIDDNTSLTDTWKIKGKDKGKKVAAFNSINEFIQVMDVYRKDIPIYIDSDLNDRVKGEVFAKTLFQKEFKLIYLSTAYDSVKFQNMPWIVRVVGKDPPF